jgi:hypothetical protein
MIAAAEREGNSDLVVKLRAGLKLYDTAQPCRPANETLIGDMLFK